MLCPLFHPLLHSFLQTLGFKVLTAVLISNGVDSFTFITAEFFFGGNPKIMGGFIYLFIYQLGFFFSSSTFHFKGNMLEGFFLKKLPRMRRVNQHPQAHNEGWMLSRQETIFCWIPVAKLTIVATSLAFFTTSLINNNLLALKFLEGWCTFHCKHKNVGRFLLMLPKGRANQHPLVHHGRMGC